METLRQNCDTLREFNGAARPAAHLLYRIPLGRLNKFWLSGTVTSAEAKLTEEVARMPGLIRRSQQLSVDFIEVELETGLTFVTVARTSADPLHKDRARARALEAYNTLLEKLSKVDTALRDKQRIQEKLKQLEQALKQLSNADSSE